MFEGWLLYSERTERNAEEFDKLYHASLAQQLEHASAPNTGKKSAE
jgi:hypothetical protein